MPRPIHKLTLTQLRKLPATGKLKLADGGNLVLQVRGPNASCLIRYKHDGAEREMGLGVLDRGDLEGNLAAVRRKAAELRELLGKGIDPLNPQEEPAAPPEPVRVPTF